MEARKKFADKFCVLAVAGQVRIKTVVTHLVNQDFMRNGVMSNEQTIL